MRIQIEIKFRYNPLSSRFHLVAYFEALDHGNDKDRRTIVAEENKSGYSMGTMGCSYNL
jgi:hypothetical protein